MKTSVVDSKNKFLATDGVNYLGSICASCLPVEWNNSWSAFGLPVLLPGGDRWGCGVWPAAIPHVWGWQILAGILWLLRILLRLSRRPAAAPSVSWIRAVWKLHRHGLKCHRSHSLVFCFYGSRYPGFINKGSKCLPSASASREFRNFNYNSSTDHLNTMDTDNYEETFKNFPTLQKIQNVRKLLRHYRNSWKMPSEARMLNWIQIKPTTLIRKLLEVFRKFCNTKKPRQSSLLLGTFWKLLDVPSKVLCLCWPVFRKFFERFKNFWTVRMSKWCPESEPDLIFHSFSKFRYHLASEESVDFPCYYQEDILLRAVYCNGKLFRLSGDRTHWNLFVNGFYEYYKPVDEELLQYFLNYHYEGQSLIMWKVCSQTCTKFVYKLFKVVKISTNLSC